MKSKSNLLAGFVVIFLIVIAASIIGWYALKPEKILLQGEAEATEIRISGKVPGRILELRGKEGTHVNKGDTLVFIDSPEINSKIKQANAVKSAAEAQSTKAIKGSRKEVISGAYEQWQKSLVGLNLAKTSFDRVKNLFDKGVLPAQKKDEAEANYNAALATSKAAKSQYDMAMNGAQQEDKDAANALVQQANAAVTEVESYLSEVCLVAPISGEIADIFPKEGELVGAGSPLMTLVNLDDAWVTFNLREDLLHKVEMGVKVNAYVPALGDKNIELEVYYIKPMASYANWKATKLAGQYDAKTFEIRTRPTTSVDGLRPGMTVLVEWDKMKDIER